MKYQQNEQLTDTIFFSKVTQQIKQICQNSIEQQFTTRKLKRISLFRQHNKNQKQMNEHQKYVKNLIIDYLRTNNLNYTYSVFMKENDILPSEVISKSTLIDSFSLTSFYTGENFRVSCIQLILSKMSTLQSQKKEVRDFSIQVQLLKVDKTVNNMLLNEVHLSNLRKEIEQKQKKHYDNLLISIKKNMSMTMKEDTKKEFETKMKEMKAQYQRQVNTLRQKNKQFLINNPKINPKVQQYLKRIEQLQTSNMSMSIKLKELQKQKISHNCFKTPKITAREQQLQQLKTQLTKKKQQYQFALSTLHTSVHNVASVHQKVNQPTKETDKFMSDLKIRKNTKQFLIDEMHGRMMIMDKRIEALSNDNSSLREQNRQLTNKIRQLQLQTKELAKETITQNKEDKKLDALIIRSKVKNVCIGVRPEQIDQTFKEKKKQHAIDQSDQYQNSDEQSEAINKKATMKLQANRIHTQMQICKNKLRFLVEDFE